MRETIAMGTTSRITRVLAVIGLLAAGLVLPVQAAHADTVASVNKPADYACSANYVCFYRDYDGKGGSCNYSQNQPRANELCSWNLNSPKSIRNANSKKVTYYANQEYKDKIGSTTAGNSGNLTCCYTVRSLKF